MKLHYDEVGPVNGHSVFLLHGLIGNANNWNPVAKDLAASGFRCISPDQRNHGKSPHSDLMSYPSMADDLFELADALGIRRFSAVGHSMGGKTAMEAALSAPDRIESLVVVDIAPVKYDPLFVDYIRALQSLDLRSVKKRSDADQFLQEKIPDENLRLFFLTNLVRTSDGGYQWRINLDGVIANYPNIWREVEPGRSFEGPTLFIRGSDSDFVTESHLAIIGELFPAYRCRTIVGAGHWVPTDRPEAFMRTLAGFLNERHY
jgi:esterase